MTSYKLIAIVFLVCPILVFGQDREERFKKIRHFDISEPIMLGMFEVAPILELRLHRKVLMDTVPFNLVAGEIGLAFVAGDAGTSGGNTFFGQDTDWLYIAPFVTAEFRKRQGVYLDSLYEYKHLYNPWMLNTGITASAGSTSIFPVGLNFTLGLSTDFDDLYARTGIAFDIMQLSFGVGKYFNLTKNGVNQSQLDKLYFNCKFILWNR